MVHHEACTAKVEVRFPAIGRARAAEATWFRAHNQEGAKHLQSLDSRDVRRFAVHEALSEQVKLIGAREPDA